MRTFKDLKVGDEIYIVNFNIEKEINSASTAKVINIGRVCDYRKITFKYPTGEVDEVSVPGWVAYSDWIDDTIFFISKEAAIANVKIWIEDVKEELYTTHRLLTKIKELK